MRKSVGMLAAAMAMLLSHIGYSQPIAVRTGSPSTISVGMMLQAAKEVLANARMPVGGAKAFAAHPAGDRWLFHTLKQHF